MPKRPIICAVFLLFSFACTRVSNDSSPVQTDQSLVVRSIKTPDTGDSREPDVSTTVDGSIVLSWVEKLDAKRHALRAALLYKTEWTQVRTVAEGDNWFINWADFPSVIGLKSGLAAHWLVKSGSATYAYDVNIAFSSDGGQTWTKPIVPHLDNTQTEHGFVSLIPLTDGRAGAIWLDGRNMKDMKDDHGEDKPLPVSMTLRYAAIDASGKISDEAQLDERVCECCQTSAALSSEGIVAVYRDRSQNEVRDIYSVSQKNGAWGTPQAVHADNWEINGCPVNGPAVATAGTNIAVAWFTGAGGQSQVKVAFSTDAGQTFGTPIQIEEGETQGRVDVVMLADNSALVCWLSGNAEGGAIKVRRVKADGSVGTPAVIAKTDISRSSGFPRMARLGNRVYVAWTEFGQPSKVRMAVVEIPA
ncbi:MAG TPA: sialidase family protein [Pyrinomonadaceae bacterium]|nr:sialidase family protein [Pyrinomonadaceae bacterium]